MLPTLPATPFTAFTVIVSPAECRSLDNTPLAVILRTASSSVVPLSSVAATVWKTVITSVLVVVVLRLPSLSFSVAATVSVKLVSFAGLIVSADKFQV